AELGRIDLQEAAGAAVDLIGRIADTLSSIDVVQLPDALMTELKAALNALLDQISLQPVHDALAQALESAPFDVLDELAVKAQALLDELEQFSPGGLIEPLQAPFDGLV